MYWPTFSFFFLSKARAAELHAYSIIKASLQIRISLSCVLTF